MRSGTTMLTTMLNSHSKLKCYAEESVDVLPSLNDNEGINVKYPHLKRGEIKNYLNEYKIIHLVRTNTFNTAISNYINDNKDKTKTPTAHIFSTDKLEKDNIYYITKQEKHNKQFPYANRKSHKDINKDKIYVNTDYVKIHMTNIQNKIKQESQTLGNHKNVLNLTYEELTKNDKDVNNLDSTISEKICNFLDVDFEDMYPTTMKVNNSSYDKYISNWNELSKLKKSSMVQWWEN
tara:strand:- start:283 stop:987 length:705 start_codon:yes stop_codon:yes gene_type:complete